MLDWSSARCLGQTDLFFDEKQTSVKKAKSICAQCPLRIPCLEWALSRGEAWGIWGGLTYQELRIVAFAKGFDPPDRREIEHGTERGWAWHRRRSEKACEECRIAYNKNVRERVARYRYRKANKPVAER